MVAQRGPVERGDERRAHLYSVAIDRHPTDIDHLIRLLGELLGRDIVDVGCGTGALVAALAGAGARATGVEVSEDKVTRAADTVRDHDPDHAHDPDHHRDGTGDGEARIVLGRGEALPLDDGSQDIVVYLRSLHHVAPRALDEAIGEARRVLRDDGVLYVVEPLPEGDYFDLVSLVEDETEVRAAARAAIERAPRMGFEATHAERYELVTLLRDVDDLRARIVGVDPARGPVFDARREELDARFREAGEPRGTLRWFAMPQQADVFRAS